MSPSPQRPVRFLILMGTLLLALLGSGLYSLFVERDAPSDRDWDANRKNLPDISVLEQRIEADLFGVEAPSTESIGADIYQVVDSEAMAAKLSGLTKHVTTLRVPTEAELEAYYNKHGPSYRDTSRFSFQHVVYTTARHGGQADLVAKKALALEVKEGDETALAPRYFSVNSSKIDRLFGNGFADKLFEMVKGGNLPCWAGPITSRHGAHLVCIDNAILGTVPDLALVRSQVINDWRFSVVKDVKP